MLVNIALALTSLLLLVRMGNAALLPPHMQLAGTFIDPAGLPMALMGSYSAESISPEATNINEFKLGLNTAIFAEEWVNMATGGPSSVQSWPKIDAWLSRSDAVGASVLFPLTLPSYMMFTNITCCDEIITAAVKRVAPHRSVVGWYLVDEPDQAIAQGTLTRVAAVRAAFSLVKSLDSRPVVACFDSTPPFENPKDVHNFPGFLPYTDVAAADIYPVAHHMPVQSQISPGIDLLRNHTDKPIVFVAQSFGGREVYTREPSAQEERIMVPLLPQPSPASELKSLYPLLYLLAGWLNCSDILSMTISMRGTNRVLLILSMILSSTRFVPLPIRTRSATHTLCPHCFGCAGIFGVDPWR